jgi:N6-adenosine-specific RNA methylase IME4
MPKFKTAIIDPPWPYGAASKHEKLSGYVTQEGNDQYPVLSIDDLKNLPVSDVMDQNEAYVFLWTTSPFIPDALAIIKGWNFKYITTLCWYKNTGLGVGYWFRGCHELVLVAKRENAPSIRTGETSVFESIEDGAFASKRLRHSAKPDDLHELIEKQREPYVKEINRKDKEGNLVTTTHTTPTTFPSPFIEIFARRPRVGWTILGFDAPGDGKDIRVSLPELAQKLAAESAVENGNAASSTGN